MKSKTTNDNTREEVNQPKRRAVAYLRSASSHQGDLERGLAHQQRRCAEVAARRGIRLDEYYEDPGASGRDRFRPALVALLERLQRSPKIDYVIVANPSRLSRSPIDCLLLEAEIERCGATLVTADEAARPLDELVQSLYLAMCEFDSKQRSQRAKAAWARKRSEAA